MSGCMAQSVYTVTPITQMIFTTGTWTNTQSSGAVYAAKTAADNTPVITIPITPPGGRRADQFGTKLTKIEIPYRATTADLDAVPGAVLYRSDEDLVVAGATGDVSVATVTTTNDGVVTADANDRLLTVTVTSPAYDYDTEAKCTYNLVLTMNCAAGTVLWIYAAKAYFEALV